MKEERFIMLAVYGWTARILGPSLFLFGLWGTFGGHTRDEWVLVTCLGLSFLGFALGLTGEVILARLRRGASA